MNFEEGLNNKDGYNYYVYKLTNIEMREKFATGKYNYEQLAKEYNIISCTARNIILKNTWKHVK
jgi:hypothetical protein